MGEKDRKATAPFRRITKAPPPPHELTGGGWILPDPKPIRVPLDFPLHYPNHLKPQTTVAIGKAFKKYPVQTQTLQFCKYVLSQLTPHFCVAARDDGIRADLAQDAMSQLIHYLMALNCRDSSECFQREQELRTSNEWMKFAKRLTSPTKARTTGARRDTGKSVNHRSEVDSYIEEVFEKTGKRITRTDIWKKARYRTRTEFERWERGHERATKAANQRFTQILLDKPHLK